MIEVTGPDLERLDALMTRLASERGILTVNGAAEAAFAAAGETLTLLIDDPRRVPEVWDVAVVLPEVLAALPDAPRTAVAGCETSRALAERFGVRRLPALLMRRDGGYVGVLEGMLDWEAFAPALARLRAAPVQRPPGVGVPVSAAAGGCGGAVQ